MKTEWLCRDCEKDPELIVIDRPLVLPRLSETGQVIEGSPQVVFIDPWHVCEACGLTKVCYLYERIMEAEPEPELEVVEVLKEAPEFDPVEEEIKALRARLEALEAE